MIGSEIKYNCEDFCWMMNSSCIIVVKIESNVVSYPLPRWIQIPIWWDISTFRTGFWCVTVSLVFLLLVGTCSHGFWWCFRSTWCENARKWKSCMWGINYVRCEILTFMIWATCECEYMKYEYECLVLGWNLEVSGMSCVMASCNLTLWFLREKSW
jgi:hypothetical protein